MTSGCAPSPWTWSVLYITGVFSVSSQYIIHRSLRHLHCLGNVRYCSPRCFHPNDFPSLADGTFPHDEVKLTDHKKLTFGVAKIVLVSTLLFKDYMVNFTHFCQTCYQVCTHHIDNFSGSHSMSKTMNNKFGKFLQVLFSWGVWSLLHITFLQLNCAGKVLFMSVSVSAVSNNEGKINIVLSYFLRVYSQNPGQPIHRWQRN